jgi:hypothetical protein
LARPFLTLLTLVGLSLSRGLSVGPLVGHPSAAAAWGSPKEGCRKPRNLKPKGDHTCKTGRPGPINPIRIEERASTHVIRTNSPPEPSFDAKTRHTQRPPLRASKGRNLRKYRNRHKPLTLMESVRLDNYRTRSSDIFCIAYSLQ